MTSFVRWILALLLTGLHLSCASDSRRDLEYDRVIDFASHQLSKGDAAAARQSLVEIRFKEGLSDQRRAYFRLLGAVNLRLESYGEAIDAFHRAREYRPRELDREFMRSTALGIARADQGRQRWLAAERHLEEALGYSEGNRELDEVYLLFAKGAAERREGGVARTWLGRVYDRDRWAYKEVQERLKSPPTRARSTFTPRARPQPGPANTARATRAPVKRPQPSPARPVRALAPRIFARQDWGAGALRASGKPEAMERPWRITIHHAADRNAPVREAEAAARMRAYQQGHFRRGWADIGYHYVIDGAGRVWEGRSMRWQGAHAGTAELNRGNIGVCLMGNFETTKPEARQVRALKQLMSWLGDRHDIAVNRMVGHNDGLREVHGKGTACPGRYLQTELRRILKELQAEQKAGREASR
jgi:tetratricopeptide (TPR) repeat protein